MPPRYFHSFRKFGLFFFLGKVKILPILLGLFWIFQKNLKIKAEIKIDEKIAYVLE